VDRFAVVKRKGVYLAVPEARVRGDESAVIFLTEHGARTFAEGCNEEAESASRDDSPKPINQ
jgi:hypothetical protein